MSSRMSAQAPRQNPSRSPVMAAGRPAGESSATRNSIRPPASAASRSGHRSLRPRLGQRHRPRCNPPPRARPAGRYASAGRGPAAPPAPRTAPRAAPRRGRAAPLGQPGHAVQIRRQPAPRPPPAPASDRSGNPPDRSRAAAPPAPATAARPRSRAAAGFSASTRASVAAISAGSAGTVRSSSTSAPSRRRRRDSTAPLAGSKPLSTVSVMRAATEPGSVAGSSGAASLMRAAPFGSSAATTSSRRFRQRIGQRQPRPAAAGQAEAARLAAPLRDPVGEARRPAAAPDRRSGAGRHAQAAAILARRPADARRPPRDRPRRAALQRRQPQADIAGRLGIAQRVALLQQRGEVGRQRRLRRGRGGQHHGRQPRMRAQPRHVAGPASVIRPSRQRAQIGQQRRGRPPARPAGGGSGNGRSAGAAPQAAQSSTRPRQLRVQNFRPVERRQAAMQRRRPQPDRHPRPLAPRPPGPLVGGGAADAQRVPAGSARCAGSSRGARRQPPSTTTRTPGTVSEVSAIEVASTTRRPSAGRNARSCSAGGRSPCSGSTSAPQPSSAAWARRISPMPGRKASTSPACAASAARTARASASGRSRRVGDVARRVADRDRMRPPGAFDHRRVQQRRQPGARRRWPTSPAAAAPAADGVAGRGRRPAPDRLPAPRSCTSSKITQATPSSPGSACSRRTSSPSVTTSMRVAAETAWSSRVR